MKKFQEYTTGPYKRKSPQTRAPEESPTPEPISQESDPWSNVSWRDAFLGGLKNRKLTANDWIERFMPKQQWLDRHPGKSVTDYNRWQEKVRRKNMNWLQRVLTPKLR